MYSANGHHAASGDRETLKRMLVEDPATGRPDYFKLQARCVRALGAAAGIFIRQIVYREGTGHDPQWTYKSIAEMQEETGLSARQQDKARKILVSKGVLETKQPSRRKPIYYRPNLMRLLEVLKLIEPSGNSDDARNLGELSGSSGETELSGNSDGAECSGNGGAPELSGISGAASKNTSERTSENTSKDSVLQTGEQGDTEDLDNGLSDSDLSAARGLLSDPDTAPGRLVRAIGKGDGRGGSVDADHVALALSRGLHQGSEDEAPRYMGLVKTFAADLAMEPNDRLERSVR